MSSNELYPEIHRLMCSQCGAAEDLNEIGRRVEQVRADMISAVAFFHLHVIVH
jgi:hypothetical protein